MKISPSRAAERAKEILRDPNRYFAEARERAERDLRTRRCQLIVNDPVRARRDSRTPHLDEDTFTRLRKMLSDDYPDILTPVNDLTPHCAVGPYEQERRHHDENPAPLGRVLSDEHADTLSSATNLAADLRALGRDEQASQLEAWAKTRR